MERQRSFVQEDEIDLIALLNNLVDLVKKYVWVIVFCVGLGSIAGIWLFYSTPKYFKSQLIAESSTLPNSWVENIVESWQVLLDKGEYGVLATILKVNEEVIKKVQTLEAKATVSSLQQPENEEKGSFTIEARVTDYRILDTLQAAIVNTLESNEYVRKRAAIRKENLQLLKKKIENELTYLDSAKSSVKDLLKGKSASSNTFLTDPTSVNIQIIELYEKILDLEIKIRLSDDIQVIQGFTISGSPDGPLALPYIVEGAVIGLVVACFIILILFLRDKRKARVNQMY